MSFILMAMLAAPLGCARKADPHYQGYLEGEFLDLAANAGGRLVTLAVGRGQSVTNGQLLFELEPEPESLVVREAQERVRQAEAHRDDLRKGARPSELAALEARLEQARAAAQLAEAEWNRAQRLFAERAIATTELDRARQIRSSSVALVAQLQAESETARLGGRDDRVRASEQELQAARAALARAEWALTQKTQRAPRSGLVHDTYFEAGETVRSNAPVVSLLPPGQVKVRFFVPDHEVGRLRHGAAVRVQLDASPPELMARVTYVATQPEFTPPIIFSRETRAKLVYMIEARFEGTSERALHPGQPVEVRL